MPGRYLKLFQLFEKGEMVVEERTLATRCRPFLSFPLPLYRMGVALRAFAILDAVIQETQQMAG